MIVVPVGGAAAAGAVLLLCAQRCLARHQADPDFGPGPWRHAQAGAPWCSFCHRCGMSLAPRAGCRLCSPAVPCKRWPRTSQAANFARTAAARLAGVIPDELWTAAGELADRIPDGHELAELLTPRPPG